MDKNKYLQLFKNGISIFNESYQQKKVLELDEKISKLKKDGKNEEEIMKQIGSVDDLIRKVYEENHVNYDIKSKGRFHQQFEKLIEMIHYIIDIMSKNTMKDNLKIMIDLLILILFICLIKIPFIVVRDFGNSLLDFIPIPIVINIWQLIIDFIYIIIAILVFVSIFKRWVQNLKK